MAKTCSSSTCAVQADSGKRPLIIGQIDASSPLLYVHGAT